jgi:hypothetical protein
MSPEVEAAYKCVHRGGIVPCEIETAEECEKVRRGEWIGAGGKRYSPATPKGTLKPAGLPADVGAGFAEGHERAIRRLNGLEPWPAITDPPAPRLSQIARRIADATFTKTHREFCQSIIATGGQLRRCGLLPQRWEIVNAWPALDEPEALRTPRRRAAHAGHDTREDARRTRALKAWETRRRAGGASDSARKAWDTRRQRTAAA